MSRLSRVQVAGLPVDMAESLDDIVSVVRSAVQARRNLLVTFVNPGAAYLAQRDKTYAALLTEFDLVLPDGIGIIYAARLLLGGGGVRISFDTSSLALPVFQVAAAEGSKVFFVGGRPGVAVGAAEKLKAETPQLQIAGVSDGFRPTDQITDDIIASGATMVIASMGLNYQERLLVELKRRGWTGVGFTCGGYFDQLQGGLRYYPQLIDRMNMRWAYRLYKEPRRLWRRYCIDYFHFGLAVAAGLTSRAKRERGG